MQIYPENVRQATRDEALQLNLPLAVTSYILYFSKIQLVVCNQCCILIG